MPVDLKALLRQALEQVEEQEKSDELEARLQRIEQHRGPLTGAELVSALRGLSDDELAELRGTVLESRARRELERRDDDGDGGDGGKPADAGDGGKPPAKRKRPGRKAGAAYDFDVDDDGRVIPLEVARVYTGDDEPDEVELPDDDGAGE